jgi:cell division protein FtsW
LKIKSKIDYVLLSVVFILLFIGITMIAVTVNSSTRWLRVAGGFRITPSEIAKFAGILLTANLLSFLHGKMKQPKRLIPFILLSVVVGLLIYKQPDLSTAIVFILVIWAMVFVSGMNGFIVGGAVGLGSLAIYLSVKLTPYRMARYLAFLDPLAYRSDEGYQISQCLYAIARGGLAGVGLGQSTLNKLYLPEPQNDFIFATLLEEFGFVGGVITIGLFLFLIYKCIKITINAKDTFGFYLGTGITAMISIHVMINLMVAVSLMPVTGIPLPFLSYGGTFLIICLSCMGVMLNISKNTEIDQ